MITLNLNSSKKYEFITTTGAKMSFELCESYPGFSIFNCSRNGIDFQIGYSDNKEFIGWHSIALYCNCPKTKGFENFSKEYLNQNNLTIEDIIEEFEPINLDCYPAWRAVYNSDEIQINFTQNSDESDATSNSVYAGN